MKENTNNVQGAISDLAALRPNWTLLADTLPAEFLRQVKAEIETLSAERDALAAELAALKKRVADAQKVHTAPTFSADLGCYAVRAWVPRAGHYALVRLEDGE